MSYSSNYITKKSLKEVEKYADKLFEELGIDIAFTHHFYERLNHPRNGKQISEDELKELFLEMFKNAKQDILSLKLNSEIVINDFSSKLNIPFVLVYDHKNQELDLVSKTIMRKRDFKTDGNKIIIWKIK